LEIVLGKFQKFGPWLLLAAYRNSLLPSMTVPSLTPKDLPFSHNTARLAQQSVQWPFKVIQDLWFSCHLKGSMRLPISDQ